MAVAGAAIAQGRHAAEAAHAELRSLPMPHGERDTPVRRQQVKTGLYETQSALTRPRRREREWLRQPGAEIDRTITGEQALREATRCLSCGSCFGCRQCWMYCNAGGFLPLAEAEPGNYFTLNTDLCEGCGKCIEVCPSGFLSVRRESTPP